MSEQDKIKKTSQYLDNMSFDEVYGQNAVEILTENAGGTALERQKTIATEETLQAVAGMNYDTTSINTSDPVSIVITYKLSGNTVATETINIATGLIEIIKT